MLSALDQGSNRRRTPVTEADVAALPTHIHCAAAEVRGFPAYLRSSRPSTLIVSS